MRSSTWPAAALGAALLAGTAAGMFSELPEAPVERLLANVEKALEESPDDPHLLYLKGRTHAVAYAMGEGATVRARPRREPDDPELPWFETRKRDRLAFAGEISDARLRHLHAGIRALRRAADVAKPSADPWDDDRPLLYLGLAWLLDDGSRFAPRAGHPEGIETKDALPEAERARIDAQIAGLAAADAAEAKRAFDALRASLPRAWPRLIAQAQAKDPVVRDRVGELLTRWWRDQALDAYRHAFEVSRVADARGVDMEGTYTISREAGEAILRLLDGSLTPADAAEKERRLVAEQIRRLRDRRMAITPVLFPISCAASLSELFPDGRTSRFDLAGDGIARTWPWPSADAGFLVWAPDPAKAVTSGRQMFGARTWWIFWRDGYEPLRMLDDDGDGRLAGAELDGIGVWCDRDGDGESDAGEVRSAEACGVTWIAVSPTRLEHGAPANDAGLGFGDGTTRPTYDWTPSSIPDPPAAH